MNNPRFSYLNISPYSRHSPSVQLKTDLKKQSSSLERPKSSKISYAGTTSRGQTPINHDITERKYSPHVERKSDLMSSLYHLAKSKQKEKPGIAKVAKPKDTPLKKSVKNTKPLDKTTEKMAVYQYLQSRSLKKFEDSKMFHASMNQTPTNRCSKSQLQEEKDYSHEKKLMEASIIHQRQLAEALEGIKSKNKPNGHSHNQQTLALLLKSTQRPSQIKTGRIMQINSPGLNMVPSGRAYEDRKKIPEPKRNEFFKDFKQNPNLEDFSIQKEQQIFRPVEHETNQKKHRRGLSSGQNPLCIDQMMLEQERERERLKLMEQYMKDPQQEEDEFFEEFFHMDQMTFDFEKTMVSQKLPPRFFTPVASPTHNKQPLSYNNGTKSIEEPNSLLPTKSTSRWTTKRSSMDDFHHVNGRENFHLIEQISDFDKTENDKDEIRRYCKV